MSLGIDSYRPCRFARCEPVLDLHRLPELFCGFPRRPGEMPTLYPVACAPQSWASGAVFLQLRSLPGSEHIGFGTKADILKADLTAVPPAGDDPRIEGKADGARSFAYQTRRRGRRGQCASSRRSVGRRCFEVVPLWIALVRATQANMVKR
jgi:hypothetical protein